MADHWNAMASAPRDGTVLLLLFHDFSGVGVAAWGKSTDGQTGWIDSGRNIEDAEPDSDTTFAGWIKAPYTAEWHGYAA